MYSGSHSHTGGSSGAHSHGPGDGGVGGIVAFAAIIGAIGIVIWIIVLIVQNMSNNARVKHDSALTHRDMEIRSASLSIRCRAVQEINGALSIGPRCSPAAKSSALVIRLRGVPADVRFDASENKRGSYSASCSLISGGQAEAGGGGQLLSRPTRPEPIFYVRSKISLPANTCVVTLDEPIQWVEVDIVRWSISDSNTATSFAIRQFRAKIDSGWYRLDASLYTP